MIERGIIEQINTRGRITVRMPDRRVVADLHSGSGGCVGDMVEGEMRPGMHTWRNVGNSILSAVHVIAIQPIADAPRASDATSPPHATAQNNRRRLS
jgi:hypothetical protein